jgi:aspartyl-tRNA(Asn)/glutamyl-tRNA(Gln) amidotransferase subunit A
MEASITGAAEAVQSGRASAEEIAKHALARVDALDGKLHAFLAVPREDVLAQARAVDAKRARGEALGPLAGVPIAVKDAICTRGLATTAGSKILERYVPPYDATVVARLRAADAVILGKTNMDEFAMGSSNENSAYGPVRNPWDTERAPGGSSGGSAVAVAARMSLAALGSDTGGSIRIPAGLCGLVGLKPTFGRVSRTGIVPHSWSLDHPGPMTRTVADTAALMTVLAGYDASDPASRDEPVPDYAAALGQSVAGLRVGVCRNHFFGRNQDAVEAAVETAIGDLASAGASVVEFRLPNLDYGLAAIFAIELASSTAYHDRALQAGRTAHYRPDVRTLVEMGRLVTAVDYLKAEQLRHVLMADMARVFETVDVIVGPTLPLTAWRTEVETVDIAGASESALAASWRLTYPYNLTGLPAISLPCGFDRAGLPIGLQIAGKPFDECMVLRVAHDYERRHDWTTRQPPL